MEQFKQGDTVYTQDGTNYYFDHVAGDHGYVSPIIIIQTTNYHGDDYDEHEEVADHMIPVPLTKLSKTPWVRKIHEETAEAIAEKQKALDELSRKIGAAHTELRMAEADLQKRAVDLERDANVLTQKYAWLRDFRLMMKTEDLHMISVEGDVPAKISKPLDMRLKLDRDTGIYNYFAQYDFDDDDSVRTFESEYAMQTAVTSMFIQAGGQQLPAKKQLHWFRQWPHLSISKEAKDTLKAMQDEQHQKKLETAEERLKAAQAAVDKLKEGVDESVVPLHPMA